MKTAKNREHAWELQERYNDLPHGFIQWKGSKVCMDVYCECGRQFHIDGDFTYSVKCPYCESVYECNGHIEIIKLEEEPDTCVAEDREALDEQVMDDFISNWGKKII